MKHVWTWTTVQGLIVEVRDRLGGCGKRGKKMGQL